MNDRAEVVPKRRPILWRADEIEMSDVQGGTKTITLVEKRTIDKGLKDAAFSEAELTRGGS